MVIVTMVVVRQFAPTLLAMEHEEIHAEAVESRHEHPSHDREVGEAAAGQVAFRHRLDDRILGIEAREKRRPDQRQRTHQ